MNKGKKHIDQQDFRRYRENRMNEEERHAFERELQKDPFLTEAFEGYESISPDAFEDDLKELKNQLQRKKSDGPFRFWAVAASILILLGVGTLFYLTGNKPDVPNMAQLKTEQERKIPVDTLETENKDEIILGANSDEEKNGAFAVPEKQTQNKLNSDELVQVEKEDEIELDFIQDDTASKAAKIEVAKINPPQTITHANNNTESVIRIRGISSLPSKRKQIDSLQTHQLTNAIPEHTRLVLGQVVMEGDSIPIPGVSIVDKSTGNGTITDIDGRFKLLLGNNADSLLVANFIGMQAEEFYPGNSSLIISMKPDQLALEEVVAIGYGTQTKSESPDRIQNARPANGMRAYHQYLEEKAVLPADYSANKVVVKLELTIGWKGEISTIKYINNADQELIEVASKIVREGPKWSPKTVNENAVESTINLRVVFRKK
ncbi:carboxypeptidase-like regulatory domain-containing protein [Mangrovibacterium lignilyticum]|uniref:carboxypeptidase-like regulatory domain-containing protein n=1 Tax=Mangrovibacterium lignilyticum TaxID=2668052 RepID=UPI0013D50B49|nr:carboxypeptidase-like regulatory domain-containing protein [Mangrovibacterium lignilyticum]